MNLSYHSINAYTHTDALGSVVAESDASGNVIKSYHYAPYGKTQESGQNNTPGYTGHVYDDDLGLNYMKARYYDPEIGRFYSNDPLGFNTDNPFSFNRYAYANNNPYKFVDPDGKAPMFKWSKTEIGAGLGGSFKLKGGGGSVYVTKNGNINPSMSIQAKTTGGAHGKVKGVNGNEAHHMPANSASPLSLYKGPSISMKKEDHRKTASWGSSKKAKAYRAKQKKLIDSGNFKKAQQVDINDIRSKFGNRYNTSIKQMQNYTKTLDLSGK